MLPKQILRSVISRAFRSRSDEKDEKLHDELRQRARTTLSPADIFWEVDPAIVEPFKALAPTAAGVAQYFRNLFPFFSWIRRYNTSWLLGDVVAGITVGLVVVPQAIAYSSLAELAAPYGLYTSFSGAITYWLLATSRDIVMGTTAVGGLLVGGVIYRVTAASNGAYTREDIANTLALLCGAVYFAFGLLRLGWIVEFVPYIPISAFVTAAGITIISTQVPAALGIKGIHTRDAPYKVIIGTFSKLPEVKLDAAIGVSSVILLFGISGFCSAMELRQPARKRIWAVVSSLRMTFTMLLFILISYLVNRTAIPGEPKLQIVGNLDRGFQSVHVPHPDRDLLSLILPEMPAVAIILVIEHIAIAKAMGRVYSYTIDPSQEVVALGAANILSAFLGGWVCTGSFSQSAVLCKAGVRTPLSGLVSAIIVVLAMYVLTSVFYFIPTAALAGIIIHAVYSLIAPPKKIYNYWRISPLESFIWAICVVIAVFVSLEATIYVGLGLSTLLLLLRLARTQGTFVGELEVTAMTGKASQSTNNISKTPQTTTTSVYLPLERTDGTNPNVQPRCPHPGVIIYRFNEGYNYTNQAHHIDTLMKYSMENTRQSSEEQFEKQSDRLWNDSGVKALTQSGNGPLPLLRAIVLDFGAVNALDVTSAQGLADAKRALDIHAHPEVVEWHFASVHNRWTRRALAAVGFGVPTEQFSEGLQHWEPIYYIAKTQLEKKSATSNEKHILSEGETDEESGRSKCAALSVEGPEASRSLTDGRRYATIDGVNRPFFHVDLTTAVASAVHTARAKDSG